MRVPRRRAQLHRPLVYSGNQGGPGQDARAHRPEKELVLADTRQERQAEQAKRHADARANIRWLCPIRLGR